MGEVKKSQVEPKRMKFDVDNMIAHFDMDEVVATTAQEVITARGTEASYRVHLRSGQPLVVSEEAYEWATKKLYERQENQA